MKLLEVLFLLISLVLGHDSMLPAGNITTHLPTPAHQCMSACVKFQQVNTQKINSINSCIVETCSLRDSPPELASYHLCRQNCMKFVNNGNNGTFPGILLTVGRTPLSDTRTREVNGNIPIFFAPSGANNSRNPCLHRQVLSAPRSLEL